MSRKLIWFYTALFCAFWTGVLVVINPALASTPLGFSLVFQMALFGLFLTDWMAEHGGLKYHRAVTAITGVFLLTTLFTVMGSVAWAALAVVLMTIAFATHYWTRKPAVDAVDKEITATEQRLTQLRTERAARAVA